jgi:hypothetical protein
MKTTPDKIKNHDGSICDNTARLTHDEIKKITTAHPGCVIIGDQVRDEIGGWIGKAAGVLFEIDLADYLRKSKP